MRNQFSNIQNVARISKTERFEPQKLDHVDALRGVAILMVIFVHTAQSVPDLPKWVLQITRYGQLGVQLFFVVSAITLSLSAERRVNESAKTKKYLIRRFFRIAPLYYIGIVWYFLFDLIQAYLKTGSAQVDLDKSTLINKLSNFLFVHGFYPPANNNVVPGGWSIGTEMAFYLCFPLLFAFFKVLSRRNTFQFLGLFVLLACGYYVLEYGYITLAKASIEDNNFMYYNLLNQLPVFALGIFAYFLVKEHGFGNLPVVFNLIGLFIFGGLTYSLWDTDLPMINSFMLIPFTAGAAFVFLFNIFAGLHIIFLRVLQKIGQVSYSMYLFHFMFAWQGTNYLHNRFESIGRPIVLFGVYYALSVALAYLVAAISEKYIERPGIEFGRRLVQNTN
ncbi:MAG: acyltransferase [Chloroflexi bacterium]|nr:acyltransferase [Chloroflexota bacterium]